MNIRLLRMNLISTFLLLVILSPTLFAAGLSTFREKSTIYDGLFGDRANAQLSAFAKALQDTFNEEDLHRFFDGDAEVTGFVPSNAAFEAYLASLSEREVKELRDQNSGVLERLLRHHIAQGAWYWRTAGPQSAPMVLPGAVRMIDDSISQIYREGGSIKVDQATLKHQTLYSNGVINEIDNVLSVAGAPAPVGCSPFVSEHNNNVYLQTITSLSASYNWFSVTSCQPHASDPSVDGSGFLVVAGRSDSSGPAGSFNNGLTANNMIVSLDWTDNMPAELNFAFSADIQGTVLGETNPSGSFICKDVRIGQGSSGTTNNWWIGQPGAYSCNDSPDSTNGIGLQCTDLSGGSLTVFIFTLLPGQGDNADTFGTDVITAGQCP
jgi:uncharacterized surface protein with fasciclin (FAS1) repeats